MKHRTIPRANQNHNPANVNPADGLRIICTSVTNDSDRARAHHGGSLTEVARRRAFR